MSLQDFFYLTLSIAAVAFIVTFCIISFFLIGLLKSIKEFVDNIDETAKGVRLLKNNIKFGILSILNVLVNAWTKKGR